MGNLVRTARIDFGAEITFLTPASYGLLPAHIRRIGGLIDETIPDASKLMPETARPGRSPGVTRSSILRGRRQGSPRRRQAVGLFRRAARRAQLRRR